MKHTRSTAEQRFIPAKVHKFMLQGRAHKVYLL